MLKNFIVERPNKIIIKNQFKKIIGIISNKKLIRLEKNKIKNIYSEIRKKNEYHSKINYKVMDYTSRYVIIDNEIKSNIGQYIL